MALIIIALATVIGTSNVANVAVTGEKLNLEKPTIERPTFQGKPNTTLVNKQNFNK